MLFSVLKGLTDISCTVVTISRRVFRFNLTPIFEGSTGGARRGGARGIVCDMGAIRLNLKIMVEIYSALSFHVQFYKVVFALERGEF